MRRDEWASLDIVGLQTAMDAGEFTAHDLVLACLERIAAYNGQGPGVNAVLEVNPDALHIARAMDVERKERGRRSLLHGIPVLVKDNIDTADKLHTSAGSLALKDSFALEDAYIVKRLRSAGAIILGKTNMTEWANFMTYNMTNGYSSRGGQVLNPYGPGRFDVGGSSSGSGAAVAAEFTVVAVGTETSGSILSPSCRNSIVGIKPTVGLVSRTGIIPIAVSQDTAGPMARSVTDAAILLGVLAGKDVHDPATWMLCDDGVDFTRHLQRDGLKGKRIGVPRGPFWADMTDEQQAMAEETIHQLQSLGAEVVDDVPLPSAADEGDFTVLLYEFKPALNAYLSRLRPEVPVHSLRDVIDFNQANAATTLRFGQRLLEESEQTSGTLTEAAYLNARLRDIRWSQAEGIDAALSQFGLHALLFPQYNGEEIAAKAGYPSIAIPMGYTSAGEPFGITLTGTAFSEGMLIEMGYALEQATLGRRPPVFD